MKLDMPTPLQQYAHRAVKPLSNLANQHPDFRKHLYTDDGRLRAFVNIHVNDEDIRYLEIRTGDSVSIVPSIAGGIPHVRQMCCRDDAQRRGYP